MCIDEMDKLIIKKESRPGAVNKCNYLADETEIGPSSCDDAGCVGYNINDEKTKNFNVRELYEKKKNVIVEFEKGGKSSIRRRNQRDDETDSGNDLNPSSLSFVTAKDDGAATASQTSAEVERRDNEGVHEYLESCSWCAALALSEAEAASRGMNGQQERKCGLAVSLESGYAIGSQLVVHTEGGGVGITDKVQGSWFFKCPPLRPYQPAID
jgi:hypothetical protein